MSSSVTMVTESSIAVTLQPQNTIASIYCLVVELEPENHFIVMEGDFVGVALPMTNSIPMVGRTYDYTLLVNPPSTNVTTSFISFTSITGGLHLYANIGKKLNFFTQNR